MQTDMIYTDYSAAFQSVNHDLLLHKLHKSFMISGRAFSWLQSYFTDREQRVVLNGSNLAKLKSILAKFEISAVISLVFVAYQAKSDDIHI